MAWRGSVWYGCVLVKRIAQTTYCKPAPAPAPWEEQVALIARVHAQEQKREGGQYNRMRWNCHTHTTDPTQLQEEGNA
jgi:hypothetical protein